LSRQRASKANSGENNIIWRNAAGGNSAAAGVSISLASAWRNGENIGISVSMAVAKMAALSAASKAKENGGERNEIMKQLAKASVSGQWRTAKTAISAWRKHQWRNGVSNGVSAASGASSALGSCGRDRLP
jgi:hypothetical protein